MSQNEIKAKVKELRELQTLKEELESEMQAIQDDIKAFMGDTEEIRIGDYKVRYKAVQGVRFDTTAFKATHSDLYNQYTKTTSYRRFSIA